MSKEKSPCIGCRFAKWALTSTGRIKKANAGRCMAEIPEAVLPLCVSYSAPSKTYIWPDMFIGKTCPLREPSDV